MTGVELVRDRATREPAGDLATRVKDAMAERGVLIGTTGRHGNVLKIRPPLCISHDEADMIVKTLDGVAGRVARLDGLDRHRHRFPAAQAEGGEARLPPRRRSA